MNKAAKEVAAILRRIFKPKDKVSPDEWCEKHIRLNSKTSNLAGRYSLRHTPYLRKLYEDIANARVRKIIVKKAAQLGLTQFSNNIILFYVATCAVPVLMIMPSKEAAQQFCERSLTPTIHDSPEVQKFVSDNPDDLKKTEFLFSSCIVRVIGAGSPSKLASNPACVCIIDEADKMSDFESQGEAPALELAEDRTLSFPNDKKIVVLSTPTTENNSIIHAEYLKGSQSKYFVACPHCHTEQVLTFEQIKFPNCKDEHGSYDLDRVEREAYYECEHCKAHLTEQDKLQMVRAGRWKDTNTKPFPSEVRSYQISALYSFNVTFGGLAKFFLLSKDDIGKLRNFYNSYLGECFEQRAATLKADHIDALVKASPRFRKGELHAKPRVLVMAADTQQANFWFAVMAIFDDGSCSLVDWGEVASFQDLYLISQRQYRVQNTDEFHGIYKALIDVAGTRTSECYDFVISTGGRFVACVGRTEKHGLFSPLRETRVNYKQQNVPLLMISDQFKNELYLRAIKERAAKLYLPQDSDDLLKKQLSSERLIEKKNSRGIVEHLWVCSNRSNHIGDCVVYLFGFKYRLEPLLKQVQPAPPVEVVPAAYEEAPLTGTWD